MERLAQVRDIFLFCCYTGLAYADIKKLKRSEIGVGVDSEAWIFTKLAFPFKAVANITLGLEQYQLHLRLRQ